MTDKDLLQEAKAWRSDLLLTLATGDLNEKQQNHTRKYKNILNDLLERAERSQKLEDENIELAVANENLVKEKRTSWNIANFYDRALKVTEKKAFLLEQQNKRYREVLESIRNKSKGDYFKTDIYILADEALEESE